MKHAGRRMWRGRNRGAHTYQNPILWLLILGSHLRVYCLQGNTGSSVEMGVANVGGSTEEDKFQCGKRKNCMEIDGEEEGAEENEVDMP